MIKFNDNNIYVGYIKQLLKNFNLPNCQVYREELSDFYSDDILYIRDNFLYRGDKLIGSYQFNDVIFDVTNNLHNTSMIYDSNTHKYLGEYLRFIRDYTGLDLMQMYNCFTNEIPVNLHLNNFNSDNSKYQLFILPIKFNRKYTIGLDCSSQVSLIACNYENKDVISTDINYGKVVTKSGTRFNSPFIYESPKVTKSSDLNYEKSLKLVIKIPTNCRSSIVVLEGDYTRGCDLYLSSTADTDKQVLASTVSTNDDNTLIKYTFNNREREINYYISRPQLLYLNTEMCYLLADRLCEYLSKNVIDCNEEIDDNIKMIQKAIKKLDKKYSPEFYGKWDNRIREELYSYILDKNNAVNKNLIINSHFDMLGYFDKDVEYSMMSLIEDDDKSFEV